MKGQNDFSEWKFILMMLVTIIVWGFAFPFIKIGLRELSFINLTIMRFFVVCCAFLLIILLQKKRFPKIQKKDIIPIFILGFSGVIIYHIGLNYGEQFISPGTASLIIATIPIQIIILVAVLIAALMGAIYTIAGKKLLDRYSGLSLTVYAILFGSIGLIPFINMSLFEQVSKMSINGWFAILFLGLCSTVIGYVIWYVALKIKTASELGVYLYAIPVLSTIFSFFIFKEGITLMFIIGGLLVITGLVIVNRKRINKKID